MGDPLMHAFRARAVLGSLAVALLAVALVAPTAIAGPGNGGGQGHAKPADAGASRGRGHESKPDRKVKPEKKAKHEKGSRPDKARGQRAEVDAQDDPTEPADAPAGPQGGPNFLAALACKDGGWQTLQGADGTPFDNQGRCVSYAVRGGVLGTVDGEDDPVEPADAPAGDHGGPNFLAALPCKDGGWQALQRADGTRFDNQGRCVSYAVRGGVIAEVVPVVTITFVPALDAVDACDATGVLGDFDPAASHVGELTVDGLAAGVTLITTDALGDASVPLGTFAADQVLALTVDGVTSGDTTVACPAEVETPEG
jgi:hypothetical protein